MKALQCTPRAGCGLCCAADRRFARHRALGCRAGADAGPAKRDPLELPLRFHGELFGRAEGRERSDAMSERQCREALLRLSAGREGGHAGARRQASRTACHSGTCGSSARSPPAPAPAAPVDSSTGGSRLLRLLLRLRPPRRNRRLLSHRRRQRCRHSRQRLKPAARQRKAPRTLQRAHHRPPPPRLP